VMDSAVIARADSAVTLLLIEVSAAVARLVSAVTAAARAELRRVSLLLAPSS